MNLSKQIILPETISKKPNNKSDQDQDHIVEPKQRQKRVITNTSKWTFNETELSLDMQLEYLKQIKNETISEANRSICKTILSQISKKIYGYKFQDSHKKNENIQTIAKTTEFLGEKEVVEKLLECNGACFYCKQPIHVLYEFCREPKQWTLERIDNTLGHTVENVVIACLHCNLHRKTMYHERYLFTKQLEIKKISPT